MKRLHVKTWRWFATCIFTQWAMSPSLLQAEPPQAADTLRIRLTITTPLAYSNTPLDPLVDFPDLIRQAERPGVLDPNSVEVFNTQTDERVAHALTEDFAYGDQGRVQFVVSDPSQREFEIRFRTVAARLPLEPQRFTPQIGVGDLLRHNAGEPRAITLFHSMGLHDVTGDGRPDLVGTWNYFYRPGSPTGGVVFYPSTDREESFRFGDLQRLRYRPQKNSTEVRDFSQHYNATAFADFNGDGRLDFVYTRSGVKTAEFYLGTDERMPGGAPLFVPGGSVPVTGFYPCRVVDLNADGALDLVVNDQYIRNAGKGWPFKPAEPLNLDAGVGACFGDLDGDGHADSICVSKKQVPAGARLVWRPNLGGDPPKFGPPQPIDGIELDDCSLVATSRIGDNRLLLVQRGFQQIHVYEQTNRQRPRFHRRGRAASISAVLSLSDQAWPCLCDWDADGDLDLLVGDGYGWPRIVLNQGTRTRPEFAEPQRILANGKTIRLLRNDLLGPPDNWHNMGYPYPDFVDWDGDGLRDLMLPNETNRIYWYRNIGSKNEPCFGSRQQILCDGYPDSPDMRAQSQRRANDPNSNNGVYPLEEERPFFWRTGVAFADFTGDGLIDFVTLDGLKRQATLFARHRNADNQLRLRRDRTLKLADGRPIDDRIVERGKHWGESLRAVDWDGDELQDLIYAVGGSHHGTRDGGSIYLLRNTGTKADPVFASPETMRCFGEPIKITNHGPHPWPGDFDGDGKPDLIACVEWSVYPYYSHAALMMKERPKYRFEFVK
jgi:hypothetical protein